jgi:hypothetical protein
VVESFDGLAEVFGGRRRCPHQYSPTNARLRTLRFNGSTSLELLRTMPDENACMLSSWNNRSGSKRFPVPKTTGWIIQDFVTQHMGQPAPRMMDSSGS